MLANCGFSADLSGPVADRAIFHTDNAYFLSDVEIVVLPLQDQHAEPHRLPRLRRAAGRDRDRGHPGRHRARSSAWIRWTCALRNLYGVEDRNVTHYQMKVEDNILQPLIAQLERDSRLPRSGATPIAAWNASSPVIKRGIAITPVKFGISFTATFFNQAGALVHVYTDGSVQVNHGGTEMGQGLNTKVAQIVADELGVPFERVRCTASGHQQGAQRLAPPRPPAAPT